MSTDSNTPAAAEPSQLHAQVTSVQGQAYEVIGNLAGSPAWTESGKELQTAAAEELEQARIKAKAEATVDKVSGKVESAYGMLTGDKDHQDAGNLKTEEATWKKAVLGEGELPQMGSETIKGKVESAVGMVTGDAHKQNEGNIRVEKAEWTGK